MQERAGHGRLTKFQLETSVRACKKHIERWDSINQNHMIQITIYLSQRFVFVNLAPLILLQTKADEILEFLLHANILVFMQNETCHLSWHSLIRTTLVTPCSTTSLSHPGTLNCVSSSDGTEPNMLSQSDLKVHDGLSRYDISHSHHTTLSNR